MHTCCLNEQQACKHRRRRQHLCPCCPQPHTKPHAWPLVPHPWNPPLLSHPFPAHAPVLHAGTHDSGAYKVQAGWLDFFAKSGIQAQDKTIRQQLDLGIRFLDLRITIDPSDNVLWVSHTAKCERLGVILDDLVAFMDDPACAREVVVVQGGTDWENRADWNGEPCMVACGILIGVCCSPHRVLLGMWHAKDVAYMRSACSGACRHGS